MNGGVNLDWMRSHATIAMQVVFPECVKNHNDHGRTVSLIGVNTPFFTVLLSDRNFSHPKFFPANQGSRVFYFYAGQLAGVCGGAPNTAREGACAPRDGRTPHERIWASQKGRPGPPLAMPASAQALALRAFSAADESVGGCVRQGRRTPHARGARSQGDGAIATALQANSARLR